MGFTQRSVFKFPRLFYLDLIISEPLQHMVKCQNRVSCEHSGSGISHHSFYPVPHGSFIAVYGTNTAWGFVLLKRAFI